MQQESDYLNDLSGVAELRISESGLRLFDRFRETRACICERMKKD